MATAQGERRQLGGRGRVSALLNASSSNGELLLSVPGAIGLPSVVSYSGLECFQHVMAKLKDGQEPFHGGRPGGPHAGALRSQPPPASTANEGATRQE